jgi:hypothetical protein
LQEGSVDIAEDMSGVLHIYLPLSHFSPSNFDTSIDGSGIGALCYETAFEDPLLAEIGCAIASELETETSAGSLLIEALVSGLAARLLQRHVSGSSTQSFPRHTVQGLDRRRLFRVLDYIEANLEGDLNRAHGNDCVPEQIPFCASLPASSRTISLSLRQRQAPPRARESLIDTRRSAIGGHSAGAQLFQPCQFHESGIFGPCASPFDPPYPDLECGSNCPRICICSLDRQQQMTKQEHAMQSRRAGRFTMFD